MFDKETLLILYYLMEIYMCLNFKNKLATGLK